MRCSGLAALSGDFDQSFFLVFGQFVRSASRFDVLFNELFCIHDEYIVSARVSSLAVLRELGAANGAQELPV